MGIPSRHTRATTSPDRVTKRTSATGCCSRASRSRRLRCHRILDPLTRIADLGVTTRQEIVRMSRLRRWSLGMVAVSCLLLAAFTPTAAQQPPAQQPPLPFAPDWALLAGWDVYAKKGCGQCHGIRSGSEGRSAPDLARIASGAGFYDLGAAMWNHLPLMGAKMREQGIERPTLTPLELSNVLAFISTAQYRDELGNPKTAGQLFTSKRWVRGHSVGGKGGTGGPGLDPLKRRNSRVLVAARMGNPGAHMPETMKRRVSSVRPSR